MIENYFKKIFGSAPARTQKTPGRVNIIGEHTDYNGGMVLPTALPVNLSIALSPRTDNKIKVASTKFDQLILADLDATGYNSWAGHAIGAVIFAHREGLLSNGADIAIEASLPDGAGLSSSAALVVGILKAARDLSKNPMKDEEIALLARRVENEFIGVPCGIMDQMAVAIAHPGQALALDTKTLDYELIDLPSEYHMGAYIQGAAEIFLRVGTKNEKKNAMRRGQRLALKTSVS